MPYPHSFRPATTCQVSDGAGHMAMDCPLQLFKPLLGCAFNGPQNFIAPSIPNMAGAILRGLVLVPITPTIIKPGPNFWLANRPIVPSLFLAEDRNSVEWFWMDAVPWLLDASLVNTNRLWSFFAAPKVLQPSGSGSGSGSGQGPIPITGGNSPQTAVLISSGLQYSTTLAGPGTVWFYTPKTTGTFYDTQVFFNIGIMTVASYGGNHTVPTLFPEGIILTGPGGNPVAGAAHTGPDALVQVSFTFGGTVIFGVY
jgi:hypothetical protein